MDEEETQLSIFIAKNSQPQEDVIIAVNNLNVLNSQNTTNDILKQFKLFKKENEQIVSVDLDENNMEFIQLPQYISDLLLKQFTAANKFGKFISSIVQNSIKHSIYNGTQLAPDAAQLQLLQDKFYQISIAPGQNITINLDIKTKLLNTFQDDEFVAIFAKKVRNILKAQHEFTEHTTDKGKLLTLPSTLINLMKDNIFAKNIDDFIKDDKVINELRKIPFLKDKELSNFLVYYMFGLVFLDASSIHVFGFHAMVDQPLTKTQELAGYFMQETPKNLTNEAEDKFKESQKTLFDKIENAKENDTIESLGLQKDFKLLINKSIYLKNTTTEASIKLPMPELLKQLTTRIDVNRSVATFRQTAAYCLAQAALLAPDDETKLQLSYIIQAATLSEECAGVLTNYLINGTYHHGQQNTALKKVYLQLEKILQAKYKL